MPTLSLQLLFFSRHTEEEARKLCKKLARRKHLKAKVISVDSSLKTEHIHCYVSAPPESIDFAGKSLKKIGERLKAISGLDDIIVQVMGHSELAFRTKPA